MERLAIFFLLLGCAIANQCTQGDNPNYRINGKYCEQLSYQHRQLCYVASVSRECCRSCERLRIPRAGADCTWGDKLKGCSRLTARQCRSPYYNDECCQSCRGTARYCRDDPNISINGYRCPEFLRYKGAHNCYQGSVLNSCCDSCESLRVGNGVCKYGDRKQRQFKDGATGVVYRCEHLRQGWLEKCAQPTVREDCCKTCAGYRGKRDVTEQEEDVSEERRDAVDINID